MLCTRIFRIILFKVHGITKKKPVLLTRDKFVYRLVGDQRTAPGRTEGKPFKRSKYFEFGVKLSNREAFSLNEVFE